MVPASEREPIDAYALLWVAAVAAFVILPTVASPQQPREIAKNSLPSVVLLVMEDSNGKPVSLGSGFVIRRGLIATNFHVIEGAAKGYAELLGQQERHPITGVRAYDADRDLALLSVPEVESPALPLADSNSVSIGDIVFVAGNPEGLEGTFSEGIVSGIRYVEGVKRIQITAPISHGSSGGPVLDRQGRVIGTAWATFREGQNLNFATASNYLARLASSPGRAIPLNGIPSREESQPRIKTVSESNASSPMAIDFEWGGSSNDGGSYSYVFSIYNALDKPVRDVSCWVVFLDREGKPVDFDPIHYDGKIPPGLSKTVTGETSEAVYSRTAAVEVRTVDFHTVTPTPGVVQPTAGQEPPAVASEWTGVLQDSVSSDTLSLALRMRSDGTVSGTYASSSGGGGTVKGTLMGSKLLFDLAETLPKCPGEYWGNVILKGDKGSGNYAGKDCRGEHTGGIISIVRAVGAGRSNTGTVQP